MPTTQTSQIDRVNEVAEQVASRNGWRHYVTVDRHNDPRYGDVWVEFAAPTHGGYCPTDPTQRTGPAWDWIEQGSVKGSWGDGQCGGCGQLNQGWMCSRARKVAEFGPEDPADEYGPDDPRDTMLEIETEFRASLSNAYAEVRAAVAERVQSDHDEILSDVDLSDEDERDRWLNGSDMNPGSYLDYLDGTRLVTWDYDPTREGEIIESVTDLRDV